MSIGTLFHVIATLIALAALIGLFGAGERTELIVLLFFGLGFITGGIAVPVFHTR